MKKYGLFIFIFGAAMMGLVFKFGMPDFVSFFAGVFNQSMVENELKRKIVGLEELLASVAWQRVALQGSSDDNTAEVIGYLLGSGGKKIFVNRGASDGVESGDWVLAGERTLLGIVDKALDRFSVVKTIFDPSLKVAARVIPAQNSSSTTVFNGIFFFDGRNFVIDFLPKETEFLSGSFVESSGHDGLFRSGFYLGRVVSLSASAEPNMKKGTVELPLSIGDTLLVKMSDNFLKE